jgi:uncharacterized membrane protein
VHGGGFYHIQKYLVAPERMPEHLTWFKWESYSDVAVGRGALDAGLLGRGRAVPDRPDQGRSGVWQGDFDLGGSLTIGWLIYDACARSRWASGRRLLMLLLFVMLVAMSWGYNQVFTGRAAMLHLGAFTATIMTANVFFIIMPNQRIVVEGPARPGARRMRNTARSPSCARPTTTT